MISREQLKLWKALAINDPWAIAREAVPILLAEVEAQAKEIERMRAALCQASDDICRGVSDHVCSVSHPTARNRWCASCIARAALKEGT